jgi:hypothetical protein
LSGLQERKDEKILEDCLQPINHKNGRKVIISSVFVKGKGSPFDTREILLQNTTAQIIPIDGAQHTHKKERRM